MIQMMISDTVVAIRKIPYLHQVCITCSLVTEVSGLDVTASPHPRHCHPSVQKLWRIQVT